MPYGTKHTLPELSGRGMLLASAIVGSDGTLTSASKPGSDDLAAATTGTGVYTLTLNPFLAPSAIIHAVASLSNAVGFINVFSSVQTNNSLVITVKTYNSSASAANAAFIIHVFAY
jgi:hypothetical protein